MPQCHEGKRVVRMYAPLPPSDEGGGSPLGGSEGEIKVVAIAVFSLPQSASLTAPSSEGAKSRCDNKQSDKSEFNKFAVAGKKFFEIAVFCVIVNMYCYAHKFTMESRSKL